MNIINESKNISYINTKNLFGTNLIISLLSGKISLKNIAIFWMKRFGILFKLYIVLRRKRKGTLTIIWGNRISLKKQIIKIAPYAILNINKVRYQLKPPIKHKPIRPNEPYVKNKII